jgi:hypothetical protein
MKPFSHYATLILFLLSTDARALGSIADIQIIDRDSGAVLDTHSFGGEYWSPAGPAPATRSGSATILAGAFWP